MIKIKNQGNICIEEIEQALENKSISLHSKIVSTLKQLTKIKTVKEIYEYCRQILLANGLQKL